MGERKVLNKYIPSDFDPSLVPKHKNTKAGRKEAKKEGKIDVRMMIPFSMQCNTCGTFMYRGKKFNSLKEDVTGAKAKYLNTQRFRFYIKCIVCSRQITFLTDPENGDYEMEDGAERNYEVWKDKKKTEEAEEEGREVEDKMDSMKALENRVEDSRREMRDLDELDEIKALNSRHVGMSVEQILESARKEEVDETTGLTREDEELARSIRFGAGREGDRVIESDEDDEEEGGGGGRAEGKRIPPAATTTTTTTATVKSKPPPAPVVLIKKKRKAAPPGAAQKKKPPPPPPSALSMLGDYGSDSS